MEDELSTGFLGTYIKRQRRGYGVYLATFNLSVLIPVIMLSIGNKMMSQIGVVNDRKHHPTLRWSYLLDISIGWQPSQSTQEAFLESCMTH